MSRILMCFIRLISLIMVLGVTSTKKRNGLLLRLFGVISRTGTGNVRGLASALAFYVRKVFLNFRFFC
jgi:hypothetical protein